MAEVSCGIAAGQIDPVQPIDCPESGTFSLVKDNVSTRVMPSLRGGLAGVEASEPIVIDFGQGGGIPASLKVS